MTSKLDFLGIKEYIDMNLITMYMKFVTCDWADASLSKPVSYRFFALRTSL